ncbi:hypothetical protein AYJ57_25430 (plasmid) [Salipiger sp. CCB-MM3]|nr:hypothetical protein AYJ57_25430 [Salipiger sp. CCB-MM3]
MSLEKGEILDGPMPSDDDLMALYGTETPEAAKALFVTSIEALGEDASRYRQLIAAIGVEEKPQSSIEAMLLTQIVTTHVAMVRSASHLNHGNQMHPTWMKMMTSASATFLRQLEVLRKMRGGGDQTVRIEHVTINDGGQAIVGAVGGGGGSAKNER